MQFRSALLAAAIAAASLTACVTAPTASEAVAADYGQPIAQADAEAKAQAYILARLKDPDSAKFTWQPIVKGWREGSGSKPVIYGYRLDGTVNAKNSLGGYTGGKAYSALFRDGQIVTVYAEQSLDGTASFMSELP